MKTTCKGMEQCDTSLFESVNRAPHLMKPIKAPVRPTKKKKPKRPDFEYRLIDYLITSVMAAAVFILFMMALAWCWQ